MIKGILIWSLAMLATLSALGQQTPAKSDKLVNDWANLFSVSERNALEDRLVKFSKSNSTQVVVITQGNVSRDLNEYCTDIIEVWGIGQKGLDNGVLLLIDPVKRNTYIATGSGTEGWLPDILAKRIVDNELLPAFKEGKYFIGVSVATSTIMKLATGEYTAADVKSPPFDFEEWRGNLPFIFIILFFGGIFIYSIFTRNKNGDWIITANGFGDSDFGGSSDGGDFGGFGGGGSSGGGAGGSW
jgi:uncharacterized protein